METLHNFLNVKSLYAIHANWEDVPVEHQDIDAKKMIDTFVKSDPKKEWNQNCLSKFPQGLRDTLIADDECSTLSGVNTKLIKTYFDVKPTSVSPWYRYTKNDVVLCTLRRVDVDDLKKYLLTKTKDELVITTVVPAFDISAFTYDEDKYTYKENDYEAQKTKFEKTICQIINPNAFMRKGKYGDHLITKNELLDIYRHDNDFTKMWLADEQRLQYERMDFLPGLKCPDDILNTYKGFPFSKLYESPPPSEEEEPPPPEEEEPPPKEVLPFLELLQILGNHREDVVKYITQWTAHMFQKPGEMPRVALVLKGEQGIGKNSYTELLKRLLGDTLYFETSDPMNDLFGRFSTFKENKLCVSHSMKATRNRLFQTIKKSRTSSQTQV